MGDRGLLLAQQQHELVVHDLDQLVPGPDLLKCLESNGLLLYSRQKIARQVEADIRFEQDAPDLPEPLLDRVFCKNAAAGKPLERGVEFTGKLVEHKPVRVTAERSLFKEGPFPSFPSLANLPP